MEDAIKVVMHLYAISREEAIKYYADEIAAAVRLIQAGVV